MEQYEIDEMRKVLSHRLLLRQLKPTGTGSVIFGAIAVFLGVTGILVNTLNVILLILGLFLLAEGIWLLAAPSPRGFIMNGCGLLGVGVWNIVLTIQDICVNSEPRIFWGVLGVLQLVWGIQSFAKARQAGEGLSVTTTQEAVNQVDALITSVMKSNFKINPHYFEVRQQNFLVSQVWKGIMLGDVVVMAGAQTQEGLISAKDDFSLALKGKRNPGKHPLGKTINGTLNAGGRIMPVQAKAPSIERLLEWKPDVVVQPE